MKITPHLKFHLSLSFFSSQTTANMIGNELSRFHSNVLDSWKAGFLLEHQRAGYLNNNSPTLGKVRTKLYSHIRRH